MKKLNNKGLVNKQKKEEAKNRKLMDEIAVKLELLNQDVRDIEANIIMWMQDFQGKQQRAIEQSKEDILDMAGKRLEELNQVQDTIEKASRKSFMGIETNLNELKKLVYDATQGVKKDLQRMQEETDAELKDVEGRTKNKIQCEADRQKRRTWVSVGVIAIIVIITAIVVTKHLDKSIEDAQAEQKIQLEQMQEQMQKQMLEPMKEQENQLEEISKMVTSVYNESNYAIFANAVFGYHDSHCYDMNNNKFYYDTDCKKTIPGRVYFRNRWPEYGDDSKGNRIKCYMMSDGRMCYIPSSKDVDMSW